MYKNASIYINYIIEAYFKYLQLCELLNYLTR